MGGVIGGIIGLVNTGVSVAKKVKEEQLDRYKKEYANRFDKFVNKNVPYNLDRQTRSRTLTSDNPYSELSIINDLAENTLPAGYTVADLERLGYHYELEQMKRRMDTQTENMIQEMNGLLNKVLDKFHEDGITKYDTLINSVLNEKDQSEYIERFNHLIKQAQIAMNEQQLDNDIAQQKATREQAIADAAMRLLNEEDLANVAYVNNVKLFE